MKLTILLWRLTLLHHASQNNELTDCIVLANQETPEYKKSITLT